MAGCPVCREEERFMIGNFGDHVIMGYIYNGDPEIENSAAFLDIVSVPAEEDGNDKEVYHHRQVINYCPICGELLTVDTDVRASILEMYDWLHEQREALKKGIVYDEWGDE